MNDYWVDGHFIAADTEHDARETAANLYGYTPDVVRDWTDEDGAPEGDQP